MRCSTVIAECLLDASLIRARVYLTVFWPTPTRISAWFPGAVLMLYPTAPLFIASRHFTSIAFQECNGSCPAFGRWSGIVHGPGAPIAVFLSYGFLGPAFIRTGTTHITTAKWTNCYRLDPIRLESPSLAPQDDPSGMTYILQPSKGCLARRLRAPR